MEFLPGTTLFRKNKESVSADEALEGKEVIAFYFSAHWCPPCRAFTPVLAMMYEELSDSNKPFEVIFVSSDRSEDAMFDYMNECHGNWLTIPHGSDAVHQIKSKFDVSGIPMLIVVKKDGSVISKNGREEVATKGARAFNEWSK